MLLATAVLIVRIADLPTIIPEIAFARYTIQYMFMWSYQQGLSQVTPSWDGHSLNSADVGYDEHQIGDGIL